LAALRFGVGSFGVGSMVRSTCFENWTALRLIISLHVPMSLVNLQPLAMFS
jgi:hypothetical protein